MWCRGTPNKATADSLGGSVGEGGGRTTCGGMIELRLQKNEAKLGDGWTVNPLWALFCETRILARQTTQCHTIRANKGRRAVAETPWQDHTAISINPS